MAIIFSASTGAMASSETSRIIGPILNWLFPDMSPGTVYICISLIRKTAHIVEYAILSILVWRALRKPAWTDKRPWQHSTAFKAFAIATFYAFTDEFHQAFVPSREGTLRDVGYDTGGVVIGLLLIWLCGRLLKRW